MFYGLCFLIPDIVRSRKSWMGYYDRTSLVIATGGGFLSCPCCVHTVALQRHGFTQDGASTCSERVRWYAVVDVVDSLVDGPHMRPMAIAAVPRRCSQTRPGEEFEILRQLRLGAAQLCLFCIANGHVQFTS